MADEKDIAEDAPSSGGKDKTKLILMGGGAVLVLLIVGAAAYFLLGDGEAADVETGAVAEAVVEEGDPIYFKLDPTFVVNLPPGGPAKMLQLAIQVMTYNPDVVDTLRANDPMIRHHLLNLLEEQQAAALMTVAGKEALQKAIHDNLAGHLTALNEPGRVKGVFFTQFVMQ